MNAFQVGGIETGVGWCECVLRVGVFKGGDCFTVMFFHLLIKVNKSRGMEHE